MERLSRTFVATALLLISYSAARAQAQCPTTPEPQQTRTRVKHRKPPSGIHVSTIQLSEMFDWDLPADISDPEVRASNEVIHDREGEAFEIEGDLWREKMEMNDCDLHLEVSEPGAGKSARRVIVEIPARAWANAIRQRILDRVAQMKKDKLATKTGDLKVPVRIKVTGVAFFDATHWTKEKPKIGNKHGTEFVKTLWELHPVFRLAIEDQP